MKWTLAGNGPRGDRAGEARAKRVGRRLVPRWGLGRVATWLPERTAVAAHAGATLACDRRAGRRPRRLRPPPTTAASLGPPAGACAAATRHRRRQCRCRRRSPRAAVTVHGSLSRPGEWSHRMCRRAWAIPWRSEMVSRPTGETRAGPARARRRAPPGTGIPRRAFVAISTELWYRNWAMGGRVGDSSKVGAKGGCASEIGVDPSPPPRLRSACGCRWCTPATANHVRHPLATSVEPITHRLADGLHGAGAHGAMRRRCEWLAPSPSTPFARPGLPAGFRLTQQPGGAPGTAQPSHCLSSQLRKAA